MHTDMLIAVGLLCTIAEGEVLVVFYNNLVVGLPAAYFDMS